MILFVIEEEDQVVLEVERGSFHWKDKDYADIEVKEKQETVNTNGNISHSKQYDFLKQFRLNDINFSIEKVRVKSNLAFKYLVRQQNETVSES